MSKLGYIDHSGSNCADGLDDDDNDTDDGKIFLRNGWLTKDVKPYFQPGRLSERLYCKSLRHRKKDLGLRKTWVQDLLNEGVR